MGCGSSSSIKSLSIDSEQKRRLYFENKHGSLYGATKWSIVFVLKLYNWTFLHETNWE